jgi:hypothetical protein
LLKFFHSPWSCLICNYVLVARVCNTF